ncbi:MULTISPECIES: DUF6318 family protein [unclassified Nocardioides]|uniref:DUF6318 family protein n=1 Tax=unclassified Nocardioides TaxID=2615069 RepID=UPI0009F12238|nr:MULTISPECIES: DUF6318 family protein [unclassified Nocardioides]GAW49833.1 hypothetical protein PD653B2_2160 [Nocardioides sp. PD653-B2]GAW54589.1 hypothetical protein PD653_2001 [Nocardioides sp. PD653]
MTRTRTVITALSCLSVLALGACSDDDPEPKFAPTPSTSAPTEASTSPAVELDPEETVKAWVEAQNIALRTGETSGLKALSSSSCRGCDDFIRPIESVYRDGGHFSTDGWTVVAARTRAHSSAPVVVDVAVSIAGGETVVRSGADPVVYETDKKIMVFKVDDDGQGSQVTFVGFVE